MDRRDFLRVSGAVTAGLTLPSMVSSAFAQAAGSSGGDGWRIFEVTDRVEVLTPVGATRVWLPLPLVGDTDFQKGLGNAWDAGEGRAWVAQDPHYGAGILAAEWEEGRKPVLELKQRVATRDRVVDLSAPAGTQKLDEATRRLYTAPTDLIPTDGIVRKTALDVTKGASGEMEKARAIYDWVVENSFRDAKTRGCGIGDIKFMLETGSMGGKCADINALFVGLCRSAGIPARDLYGVRVADSRRGYKSLGKSGDVTKAQHCRAEFYAQGRGWIPVDPGDVRKVILEEPPGNLAIDDAKVRVARKYLFGAWEMNWVGYNYGHDLQLPGAQRGRVGFLMYPQCETAEGRLDCLDPDNFKYQITTRELTLA
jgi:transglutaminase-like putative cysteine protease